jgi:hypothetical protein
MRYGHAIEGGHDIKVDFEISGLDAVRRSLAELRDRAEAIAGEQEVSISELFPPDFMAAHTEFDTWEGMFSASGFSVETAEDFEKIPDEQWDTFVRTHTKFANWHEMLSAGSEEWVARKLGF